MSSLLYNKFSENLKKMFGCRVQKISVNGGFSCPNRDGTKGVGGCTFCNNKSFLPEYCQSQKSVKQQIIEGISFFKKYESQKYIAYFQSYTNTYGSLEHLENLYEQALFHPRVVGLAIGTRPDCVDEKLLDFFAELAQKCFVLLEYGVESTDNETLKLINRGHTFEHSAWAINETSKRGIFVGAHLILGLPKEDRVKMLLHAKVLSGLPVNSLKLHQLQILKNTAMALDFEQNPSDYQIFTMEKYIDLLIEFLELLNPKIALERFVSQSPPEWIISPKWSVKNYEFTAKLEKRMCQLLSYQGKNQFL
ncbi:MAG: TIGR01212 family radical SAM protein [Prevotellaceae bacterium]|jgi:radical SAM protein (TIGR01212 family)|nr:TIGR01212 family radical SAM protein [Prevotellaceae bacterium]